MLVRISDHTLQKDFPYPTSLWGPCGVIFLSRIVTGIWACIHHMPKHVPTFLWAFDQTDLQSSMLIAPPKNPAQAFTKFPPLGPRLWRFWPSTNLCCARAKKSNVEATPPLGPLKGGKANACLRGGHKREPLHGLKAQPSKPVGL